MDQRPGVCQRPGPSKPATRVRPQSSLEGSCALSLYKRYNVFDLNISLLLKRQTRQTTVNPGSRDIISLVVALFFICPFDESVVNPILVLIVVFPATYLLSLNVYQAAMKVQLERIQKILKIVTYALHQTNN